MKVPEIRPIPLDRVTLSEYNARKQDAEVDLDDLKASILQHGLLQPIVVFERNGQFECIIGQRRLLAHQRLNEEGKLKPPNKIVANVVDEKNAAEARVLSIVENLQRAKLSPDDIKASYKFLLQRYSSLKVISQKLGYTRTNYRKIIEGIGYDPDIIPSGLRTLVDQGKLSPEEATDLTIRNWPNTSRAVSLGKKLVRSKKLTPFERDRIIKSSNKDPRLSPEQVIKKYRKKGAEVRVGFHLTGAYAEGLIDLAQKKSPAETKREMQKAVNDASKEIVETALRETGYVKE